MAYVQTGEAVACVQTITGRAPRLGPGKARLVLPPDYDPEDEDWEFKPGSIVWVELRQIEGVEVCVAVTLAE